MDASQPTVIAFNTILVDLGNESVRSVDGTTIVLRPQTFATFRYLIEHANRLVTKSELMQAVWAGKAVTDDSLVQCVHEIRHAIKDARHDILQTVSRRGYRLILPAHKSLDLPSGPSLAVLPFASLGELQGHDYFADGLVDDLVTNLSRIPGLFVVASRSTSMYRDKAVDVRKAAAELGVRYLVDGSISKSGDHVRIYGMLVDGASAAHIWADRFDGSSADIFELQDRLTEQIVGIVEPSIRKAEIERARRKRPESLDAYDLYLRAVPHVLSNTRADADMALQLLKDSLRLDPTYLPAHAYAAWCQEQRYLRNGFDPGDRANALRHADIILGVASDDPQALSIAAFVRANLTRDYDGAIEVLDRAIAMNGNSALAFGFSSLVSAHSERHDRATAHAQMALRLSPLADPLNYHPYCALALTNFFAGEYAEAVKYANLTIGSNPGFSVAYAYLIASQVNLGHVEAAHISARRLLGIVPTFSVDGFARMELFRPPLMEAIAVALRKAGLPLR